MTKRELQILAKIRKLDAELSLEITKLESKGKKVTAKYNPKTNKDELHVIEA